MRITYTSFEKDGKEYVIVKFIIDDLRLHYQRIESPKSEFLISLGNLIEKVGGTMVLGSNLVAIDVEDYNEILQFTRPN